jgi:enediyne biosynthesis protein E4
MSFSRRDFVRSLCAAASVFSFDDLVAATGLPFQFTNVAREAGLRTKTIFGGETANRYLLETTGCGVAFFDFDDDGWLDIFLVNGTRFEAKWAQGEAPTNRLYKNNRDGTFTDITLKAGLARTGWGQGCCVGDYDNDGHTDLLVTYWGDCVLYHNNGNQTFTDVSERSGIAKVTRRTASGMNRWNTGCAFLDYDRDGFLDLFIANYIDFDPKTVPVPESGKCRYKGIKVACGPPGLTGGKNVLLRNNGDGTFRDVSAVSGILKTPGTYGLGVLVSDFDDDGWPDIYVANDSTSSALYRNNHDGTFTDIAIEAGVAYSPDGKPQAGMGVAAADYDADGRMDIVKTNFAGDTSSLYRNLGNNVFEDMTMQSGLGLNTRFLGWGAMFGDFDNDGHPDILLTNGHVYPEVGDSATEYGYRQRKVLYRNMGNGRFADVSAAGGPGVLEFVAGRGCAIGDFDNDGDLDVVVNCVNALPQLLKCDNLTGNRWIKLLLVGTKSNRSAIGARVICSAGGQRQIDEVRSGGSYISQNDLRVHFGLAGSETADIEIRWPSGHVDQYKALPADRIHRLTERSS